MSDLRLEFDTLLLASARLGYIAGDLKETGYHSTTALDVDHGRLRDALRDFRDAWEVRRNRIGQELDFIGEYVKAVHDTFKELDADYAKRAQKISQALPTPEATPAPQVTPR